MAAFAIVVLILVADQILKYWVKTNMTLAQEIHVAGNWFVLHFTENDGMAFGLKFGGITGKLILTSFRIVAVIAIAYYLFIQVKKGISLTLTLLMACILAGAMGNIIDSVFYGHYFTESTFLTKAIVAPGAGYSTWFRGKVVDMLYFPLIETHYPSWVPKLGGREFIFFRPVFNLADAAISVGVFSILIFFRNEFIANPQANDSEETAIASDSEEVEDSFDPSEDQEQFTGSSDPNETHIDAEDHPKDPKEEDPMP
ncbi:MAG: lipoprotein signal peptidase [Flavobacteriales bacterium]|nr:lipoprotein signal peptidase [Flavobacteriales bacterium]